MTNASLPPVDSQRVHRRGAVGVVVRDDRFLVIRRSRTVRSPRRFCFPGGGIEGRETEEEALIREFQEELDAAVIPTRRLWRSTTLSGVDLAWWSAELVAPTSLRPNPAEVESIHWFTRAETAALDELLESNHRFLAALDRGEFVIPFGPGGGRP